MTHTPIPTPKQKLAASRAALLSAMGYEAMDTATGPRIVALEKDEAATRDTWSGRAGEKLERSALGRWWRRSHLSTAAELGRPLLQDYASRHPAKLIAYAAGAGGLIVLAKPWRLLSLGMVAGLLWKSTDVAGFISDCLVPELGDTESPRDDFLDAEQDRAVMRSNASL